MSEEEETLKTLSQEIPAAQADVTEHEEDLEIPDAEEQTVKDAAHAEAAVKPASLLEDAQSKF